MRSLWSFSEHAGWLTPFLFFGSSLCSILALFREWCQLFVFECLDTLMWEISLLVYWCWLNGKRILQLLLWSVDDLFNSPQSCIWKMRIKAWVTPTSSTNVIAFYFVRHQLLILSSISATLLLGMVWSCTREVLCSLLLILTFTCALGYLTTEVAAYLAWSVAIPHSHFHFFNICSRLCLTLSLSQLSPSAWDFLITILAWSFGTL